MPLPHQESDIQEGEQVSEHEESSEWIKVKYSGRKNLCEICDNILAKYTCPKCQLKTCSLACTKKHKQVKQCSGQRDPVEYVKKDQIDEKVVSKDYNFIEEMISGADKVKKVLSGVNTTITLEPRRFKILRTNAKQLYNIRLSNGPSILERHRDNISFFYVKNKSIYWVFELMYYQGHNSKNGIQLAKTLTQPISDEKKFVEVLPQDFLDRNLLQLRAINTTKREEFQVFLQNKEKLSEWHNESENVQKNAGKKIVYSEKRESGKFKTLYQLIEYDTERIISEQMRDISVFEFPSLYVVHKSLREDFLAQYRQSKGQRDLEKETKETEKKYKQKKERGTERERERGAERERSRDRKSDIQKI